MPNESVPSVGESDFREAAALLLSRRRPVLVTHDRPDGDGLGCLLAMRAILADIGRPATAVLYEPCPRRYAFLEGVDALQVVSGPEDPVLAGADGILILDTCTWSQLHPVEAWLRGVGVPKIALDHHTTRDAVADRYLVDPSAAAASLLVYEWARAAGWNMPAAARQALFVGIATDTGWFRFSNTTARALAVAAELVAAGVDPSVLYERLYLTEPVAQLRLRAAALGSLDLYDGDSVAVMTLSTEALAAAGATQSDTEDLVNLPMSAAAVEVAVLLTELGQGIIKTSFRSKGAVDVAKLAQGLGGGGHSRAAGARIAGSLAEVKSTILDRIRQARR